MGTVKVVLSESLREYVWTAEIAIGSDQKQVALVSLARDHRRAASIIGTADHAEEDIPVRRKNSQSSTFAGRYTRRRSTSSCSATRVPSIASNPGIGNSRCALPIPPTRTFPRDLRGRLLLRRDHLFDVYLPGRSAGRARPRRSRLDCMATDDPWPLDTRRRRGGSANLPVVRAFYAALAQFLHRSLSPGIGKISNVPSFYSAAALPRSNYTLWMLAAVDGSLHLVDGITDQAMRGGALG